MQTSRPRPRAHTIRRPRLFDKLTRWRETQLVQIVSPAGYGKTTLAAMWLNDLAAHPAENPPHIAWVSLTSNVSADRLFTFFIDALTPHIPAVGDLRNVDGGVDFTAPLRIQALCREIAAAERPLVLALDDVHLLTDATAHALLQQILDAAPPPLHLLLLSRSIPPLQLGRLILDDALITLTSRDLAFDHEEFLDFMREFGLAAQPDASLAALEQHSAGWIAGLKLLTYDLLHNPTAHHAPHAEDNLDEFFSSRVLTALPAELRRFCELAAPLPFLTAELMTAVTQRPESDCDAALRSLAAANAFLTTFTSGDSRHLSYRFHPLFHDFLRRRAARHAPGADAEIRTRAAVWLCDHDDVDAALEILNDRRRTTDDGRQQGEVESQSKESERSSVVRRPSSMVDALAAAVRRAVLRYDHAAVKRWLQALPTEWVASHAPLAVAAGWHVWAVPPADITDAFADWQRAAAAAAALPPDARFDELRAESAVLQALHSLVLNDREDFRRRFIAAERLPHAADGLAAAYLHMLRAVFFDVDADVETRLHLIRTAADICERIGFGHGTIEIMNTQMMLQWRDCRFDAAQASAAHLQAVIAHEGWRYSTYVPEIHFRRGEMYYLTNQLPAARTFLLLAMETGRADSPTPSAFAYSAQLLLQLCDAAESPGAPLVYDVDADAIAWTNILHSATPLTRSLIAWPRLLRDFRAGRLDDCRRTFDSLQITPTQLVELTFESMRLAVLAGAVFLGQHDAVVATQLGKLRDFLETDRFHIMRLQVQALQILHAQQCGDARAARRFLDELLPEIKQTGMIRLLLDLPPLHPLLAACDSAFAHSLLACMQPPTAQPHVDILTRQELQIMKLLADDYDPKDVAASLSISVGTVRNHIYRIYRKLGVHTHAEAVRAARAMGLGS